MEPNVISEQDELKNGTDRPGRRWFTRRNVCLLLAIALLILTAFFFLAVNIYHEPGLDELLMRAKLAKLPESIRNLQVDMRPFMSHDREVSNRAELFILFQAEQNDIETFITNSPGIDKKKTRQLPPLSDYQAPAWWPTDQSASGRMYYIYEQKDIDGMVLVYDDSNTVRIWMLYTVNPRLRDMQDDFEDVRDACEDFVDDMLHEVLDLFD